MRTRGEGLGCTSWHVDSAGRRKRGFEGLWGFSGRPGLGCLDDFSPSGERKFVWVYERAPVRITGEIIPMNWDRVFQLSSWRHRRRLGLL